MANRAHSFLIFVTIVLGARPARPQSAGKAGAGVKTPQLAARSAADSLQSVALDVVVRDGVGRPMHGLGVGDFVVRDGNRLVAASELQVKESNPDLIFVVDAMNSSQAENMRAMEGMEAFLKARSGKLEKPVTILILSDTNPEDRRTGPGMKADDTRVLQKRKLFVRRIPPSKDADVLIQALHAFKPGLPRIMMAQGASGDVERVQLSLNAISFIAKAETPVPGPKLVVWISPAWPFVADFDSGSREAVFDSLIYFSDVMRVGRMVLYAVDPEGVTASNVTAGFRYLEYRKGVSEEAKSNPNDLTLQVLAYQSGGLVLPNSNDVGAQLLQCAADAQAMYTVSYVEPPGNGKDTYHPVSVRLARDGRDLRTRTGLYAR